MKRALLLFMIVVSLCLAGTLCAEGGCENQSGGRFYVESEYRIGGRSCPQVDTGSGWPVQCVDALGDKRWKHWAVQPGVRYWLCDRFGGSYFGAYLHGGQYNVGGINLNVNFLGTDFRKLKDTRYQGWFVGGGVSYGYAFVLSRHWNLETEIGIGYSYTRYDRFRCVGCGKKVETDKPHHYVGPTKAAINLVYLF